MFGKRDSATSSGASGAGAFRPAARVAASERRDAGGAPLTERPTQERAPSVADRFARRVRAPFSSRRLKGPDAAGDAVPGAAQNSATNAVPDAVHGARIRRGTTPGLRPASLRRSRCPRFWVSLRPPDGKPLGSGRLRVWSYVLQALRIPHLAARTPRPEIFVPAFLEGHALTHVLEYEREGKGRGKSLTLPPRPHAWLAFLALLPMLVVWVVERATRLPALPPGFPKDPDEWTMLCAFDSVRVTLFGEWSRAFTALFLHEDLAHLAANTAFSLIFIRMLARRSGFGLAVLATFLVGALANVATLPFREGYTLSIGFSTALFAVVGMVSGLASRESRAFALLPLACGAGLLAMLGTGGENTDYAAHVSGLVCGMGAGLLLAPLLERRPGLLDTVPQSLFLAAGLAIPLIAFHARLF